VLDELYSEYELPVVVATEIEIDNTTIASNLQSNIEYLINKHIEFEFDSPDIKPLFKPKGKFAYIDFKYEPK
jgi:hypothetical protein